jgi:major membrane immunogen (membrane-anchored lipoprotein)
MNFVKKFSMAFLCGLLVLTLVICGCTSSDGASSGPDTGSVVSSDTGGYAGTYTNTDDAATTFVLKADGKFQHTNGASSFSGTYTYVNGELKICTVESDGTSCIYAPVAADGSFTYGLNTFRK